MPTFLETKKNSIRLTITTPEAISQRVCVRSTPPYMYVRKWFVVHTRPFLAVGGVRFLLCGSLGVELIAFSITSSRN